MLAVLNGVWGVKMHHKALVWQADIVGGLLLGAGISIAGACPGTVFAQIGAGYRDAWFAVAGGVLGVMAFGYLEPTVRRSHVDGGWCISGIGPWHQVVDAGCRPAVDELCEDVGEPGVRIDAIELGGLD